MPRLCDLGVTCKLRARYVFVTPMTRELFLANHKSIQDIVFTVHVRQYCRRFMYGYHRDLINEKGFSLTGLIGVAHLLGFLGACRWARATVDERIEMVDGLGTSGAEYYELLKDIDISDFLSKYVTK